jgi:hypothetical protein
MDETRVTDHGHTKDPRRRWMRNTFQEGPGVPVLRRAQRPAAAATVLPRRPLAGYASYFN